MRKYPYDYTIYPENSPEKFRETCAVTENKYPDLKKRELLIDVDGSTIQVYDCTAGEVIVYDDYDVGAVYILSDMDLDVVFNDKRTDKI